MLDGLRQNAGSWIIKILFAIIILAFIFAYGSGTLSNKGGAVLAYVDDTPVLIKDFQTSLSREMEQLRTQMPNLSNADMQRMGLKEYVLQSLVNSVLVKRGAEELGLSVADQELKDRIRAYAAFRNQDGGFDSTVYQAVLRGNNLTPGEFEDSQRAALMAEKLQRHLASTVIVDEAEARDYFLFQGEKLSIDYLLFPWKDYKDGIEPTQTEIEAYYNEKKELFKLPARASFQYLLFTPKSLAKAQVVTDDEVKAYYAAHTDEFARPEQVRASHILIKLDEKADDKAVAEARAKLLKVKARLAKGADFAEMAKKYSEGPSNVRGGELGWFSRGMMVPAFEEAAFGQEAGVVGDPVRTRFGWHLIKVEERREAGTEPLGEVATDIKSQLAEEKAANEVGEKLDQAIDQIIVGDTLAKVAETLDMNLGSTGPMTRQMLLKDMGVDADAATAMFDIPINTASDTPVSVQGGYMLVSKTNFVEATYSPLEKVTDSIVEALKREGAMALAKEKADAALARLAASGVADVPVEYADKLVAGKPFGRKGVVPDLGMNPPLVEAAFAAPSGKWLETSFPVEAGYVVARVGQRIAPPEDVWTKSKDAFMTQFAQAKGRELFQAFVSDLRDKAEIKVVEPRLLEYAID